MQQGLQAKSASIDSGLHNMVQTNASQEEGTGEKRSSNKSESSDFDTLPELASLQDSPEFQGLSQKNLSARKHLNQNVKLVFSGLTVKVVLEESGEELLKRKIRTIVCCAQVSNRQLSVRVFIDSLFIHQGKKEGEYLGFTTKEGPKDSKAYYMHLFLSESFKMVRLLHDHLGCVCFSLSNPNHMFVQAANVLETFKSAFVHALSITMPAALCDSCPLQELHNLCKRLEGQSFSLKFVRCFHRV